MLFRSKGIKELAGIRGIKKIEFDSPKKDVPESGYDGFFIMVATVAGVVFLAVLLAVLIKGK